MEPLTYLDRRGTYCLNPSERPKKHLWVFGDSFTAGNGCLANELYTKYKKSDEDIIWPEIISSKLNMPLVNVGMGMFSNDKILDTLLERYDFIYEGDLVIISKTFFTRFDIPSKNEKYFITLSAGHINNPYMSTHHFINYTEDELNTLKNIAVITDSKLTIERWNFRFDCIKRIIESKGVKVLVWEVENAFREYDTIQDATNNKINDGHWSYKGHKDFANYIINLINKPDPPKKLI